MTTPHSDELSSPGDTYVSEGKSDIKIKYPEADFKTSIGVIPFLEPNVRPTHESEDLLKAINKEFGDRGCETVSWNLCCSLTGIGLCWVLCRMQLIEEGQWGFVMHSGQPEMKMPGRYYISSPLSSWERTWSQGDDLITCGPVTIVRVPKGSVGLAFHNSQPEILLPGRHVRTSSTFKFDRTVSLQNDLIEFGPVKLLTVKSGGVRVCYHAGHVEIFPEGRYAINSSTFVVAGFINTQQQNVKFDQHKVLLDGGISLLVEGLLTFQVVDPALLIKQLGERDLLQAVSQVTKAELSRVFSSIHLEQISTAQMPESKKERKEVTSVLGAQPHAQDEGETRNEACADILRSVRPIAEQWGVKIINFQLESTTLADKKYAAEYEEASLAMAKAKSNRRAIEATNDIMIQKAKAAATALKIEAEGQKTATLIQAEAKAEARRIEAKGRNDAADLMTNEFAKKFALSGQQVEFASALKAKVLTVVPGSSIGGALLSQSAFVSGALSEEQKSTGR
jgi:regulator of protease activity HflC (stomatin/prohibitin superfamily)